MSTKVVDVGRRREEFGGTRLNGCVKDIKQAKTDSLHVHLINSIENEAPDRPNSQYIETGIPFVEGSHLAMTSP